MGHERPGTGVPPAHPGSPPRPPQRPNRPGVPAPPRVPVWGLSEPLRSGRRVPAQPRRPRPRVPLPRVGAAAALQVPAPPAVPVPVPARVPPGCPPGAADAGSGRRRADAHRAEPGPAAAPLRSAARGPVPSPRGTWCSAVAARVGRRRARSTAGRSRAGSPVPGRGRRGRSPAGSEPVAAPERRAGGDGGAARTWGRGARGEPRGGERAWELCRPGPYPPCPAARYRQPAGRARLTGRCGGCTPGASAAPRGLCRGRSSWCGREVLGSGTVPRLGRSATIHVCDRPGRLGTVCWAAPGTGPHTCAIHRTSHIRVCSTASMCGSR